MRHGSRLVLTILSILFGCAPGPEPPPAPPAGPQTGTVASADGTRIAYTVTGTGSPALVFIHGWMCDQTYWKHQVAAFEDTYQVVTIDLPGHGSAGLDRAEWTVAAFGDDVRAVADHLGLERMILVGHSMGGPVALEAAPLLGDRVVGIVRVDTFQDFDAEYDREQWLGFVAALENDFGPTCDGFVRSMFPEDAEPGLVDRISGDMCSGPGEIGSALMRHFVDYDDTAILARVSQPIRAVNSGLWPTDVEGNRELAPGFDAVVMIGPGHFLMLERPDEFNTPFGAVIRDLAAAAPHQDGT